MLSRPRRRPFVSKPVKTTLTATLGGVSNSWDFWVFPRRALRDGSAIAVAPRFRVALEKRYANLLAPEAAARAKVVVAEYGTLLAAEALARGQRVVTLAGTEGKPNVSLGWWWMGRQVGTALAQHPALAALPHEGVLSPLAATTDESTPPESASRTFLSPIWARSASICSSM